jgi:hypothetical protein
MAASLRRKAEDPGSIPEIFRGFGRTPRLGWRQPMEYPVDEIAWAGPQATTTVRVVETAGSPLWGHPSAKGVVVVATPGAGWVERRR